MFESDPAKAVYIGEVASTGYVLGKYPALEEKRRPVKALCSMLNIMTPWSMQSCK